MSLRTGMLIRSAGMGLLLCVAAAANADVMKWTVDGTPREAIVIAPAKTAASGTAPVIFAFHGHGGNMQEADAGMRFENLWPQAVVVYPQGLPTDPSADPHGYGWVYNTNRYGDRDLKFFDAMLATLRGEIPGEWQPYLCDRILERRHFQLRAVGHQGQCFFRVCTCGRTNHRRSPSDRTQTSAAYRRRARYGRAIQGTVAGHCNGAGSERCGTARQRVRHELHVVFIQQGRPGGDLHSLRGARISARRIRDDC